MVQFFLSQFEKLREWRVDPAIGLVAGLAYAILLSLVFIRARRNFLALPELAPCTPQEKPPDCMVVIPARNEEGVIGRAVRSLPEDSVIVVDDESTDGTAKEAEEAGAGVLRAPVLPRGAVGKAFACSAGARAIRSKWILFSDADTWYEEGIVESLLYAAEANQLSFVSVHLKVAPESFPELLLAPYAQALFFTGIDPRKCPEGAFHGTCILVRREAYEFIGGHGASLTFLVDDVKLALLALRHRMKIGLARTSELGFARFHKGWAGLWEGIARNSFRYTLLSGTQSTLVAIAAVLGMLWLPMAAVAYLANLRWLALAIALLPVALMTPWYGSPVRALLAPVAVYAMLPMLGNALYHVLTSARVSWKGRDI